MRVCLSRTAPETHFSCCQFLNFPQLFDDISEVCASSNPYYWIRLYKGLHHVTKDHHMIIIGQAHWMSCDSINLHEQLIKLMYENFWLFCIQWEECDNLCYVYRGHDTVLYCQEIDCTYILICCHILLMYLQANHNKLFFN